MSILTGVSSNVGTITAGATPGDNITSITLGRHSYRCLTFTVGGSAGNVSVKTVTITYTSALLSHLLTHILKTRHLLLIILLIRHIYRLPITAVGYDGTISYEITSEDAGATINSSSGLVG